MQSHVSRSRHRLIRMGSLDDIGVLGLLILGECPPLLAQERLPRGVAQVRRQERPPLFAEANVAVPWVRAPAFSERPDLCAECRLGLLLGLLLGRLHLRAAEGPNEGVDACITLSPKCL